MPALAYVVCESRVDTGLPLHDGADWQAEARFLVAYPGELMDLLGAAGLSDRPHPPNLSTLVSADILFEDGDIVGRTQITVDELPALAELASQELRVRVLAWGAFARSLEVQGQVTRLIIWFIR